MADRKTKQLARKRRRARVRSRVCGTATRPRLSVFRSASHLFIQLIDDRESKTLVSVSDREVKGAKNPTETALKAGKLLAQKALNKKIEKVVFDRGGYKYHGRVKAVAEGAREGGLKF